MTVGCIEPEDKLHSATVLSLFHLCGSTLGQIDGGANFEICEIIRESPH